MKLLDLTLPTPEENLALDDALLESAEQGESTSDILRIWQPQALCVVIGRSSKIDQEVDLPLCQERDVRVLRRGSGGASIVTGPGCLMYAVILAYQRHPELRAVDEAHKFVLEKIAAALPKTAGKVQHRGISDLALGDRKFSGNSIRARRDHLLYHGTILYDFDLTLIGQLLKTPPRQPDYREQRDHTDFVTNLPLPVEQIRASLVEAFDARESLNDWPKELTAQMVKEKYGKPAWHERI